MVEPTAYTIGGNVKGTARSARISEQVQPTIVRDLTAMLRQRSTSSLMPDTDRIEIINYACNAYRDGIEDGWHQGAKLDPFIRAVLGAAWKMREALGQDSGFEGVELPPRRLEESIREIHQLCVSVGQLQTHMILDGIEKMGESR